MFFEAVSASLLVLIVNLIDLFRFLSPSWLRANTAKDEPWKILTGKQITMKLSSASSEFCGSTRSMSKVMSVSKNIGKSFTQYQILSFFKLAGYLISHICIVGKNIISSVWSCNENFLNMKFCICCDYRTTILSNSFFHATTLLSIYHEKFSN